MHINTCIYIHLHIYVTTPYRTRMYLLNIGLKIHHLWCRGVAKVVFASHSSTHGKADHNSEGATIATAVGDGAVECDNNTLFFFKASLTSKSMDKTSTTFPKKSLNIL